MAKYALVKNGGIVRFVESQNAPTNPSGKTNYKFLIVEQTATSNHDPAEKEFMGWEYVVEANRVTESPTFRNKDLEERQEYARKLRRNAYSKIEVVVEALYVRELGNNGPFNEVRTVISGVNTLYPIPQE